MKAIITNIQDKLKYYGNELKAYWFKWLKPGCTTMLLFLSVTLDGSLVSGDCVSELHCLHTQICVTLPHTSSWLIMHLEYTVVQGAYLDLVLDRLDMSELSL